MELLRIKIPSFLKKEAKNLDFCLFHYTALVLPKKANHRSFGIKILFWRKIQLVGKSDQLIW